MIEPRPRRPARKRRRRLRLVVMPLALGVVLVIGVGLGEALHDNPKPGGSQTIVRTLRPLPLVPVARDTVTVTTTTSP
ncbi:MAG TPA: hypothetical protein VG265_13960 [Gaiellaceae bacterium]|nr:hypothetical protein [Gaiellaceae bacterium]